MKMKNLSWSMLVAATALTACSNDDFVPADSMGAEQTTFVVPTIDVNLGGTNTLGGTVSENGGWTNFKKDNDGMQAKFDARVLVQFFQEGSTTPVAQAVKFVKTIAADGDDHVNIDNVKLPTGTYTAVTWVDFVQATDKNVDGTDTDVDYYYETENLSSVKDNGSDVKADDCMESRDAYTGTVTFTMGADGTTTEVSGDNHGDGETGSFCIQAKRKFGKVRVIMNDYGTKAQWERYFSADANKKMLSSVTSTFKAVATSYNALTQTPIPSNGGKPFSNTITWGNSPVADLDGVCHIDGASISWVVPGAEGQNKFTSIDDEAYQALDVNAKVYPVLDYNYVIPASNDDAAAYDLTYVANDGTNDIKTMELSNIPVRTNTLTTVVGPFLTYTLKEFKVFIDDNFDSFKYADVSVDENGVATSAYSLNGVVAKVESKQNGDIAKITIGNIFDATQLGVTSNIDFTQAQPITAANFDGMVAEMAKLPGLNSESLIDMTVASKGTTKASLPTTVDLSSLKCDKINLTLNVALTKPATTITAASDIDITSTAKQTANLTVNAPEKDAKIVSGSFVGLAMTAEEATIEAGTFTGIVTMDATKANIETGTFSKDVTLNSDDASAINGGTYTGLVTLNADGGATVTDGVFNGKADITNADNKTQSNVAILATCDVVLNAGKAKEGAKLYMNTNDSKTLTVYTSGDNWVGSVDTVDYGTGTTKFENPNNETGWDSNHLSSNFNK